MWGCATQNICITFQVTSILGWDEDIDLVYFIATETGEPGTRQLYTVKPMIQNLIGRQKLSKTTVKCITCKLSISTKGGYSFIAVIVCEFQFHLKCVKPHFLRIDCEMSCSFFQETIHVVTAVLICRQA